MPKKLLAWTWRILGGTLLLLVFLAGAGAIYQWQATKHDRKAYPPPGKFVDLGDHQLHLYCTGSGSPTVILESGSINTYMSWSRVQPEVAEFTRVCSYDRAGLGWSSAIEKPLSGSQITENLHRLLNEVGIKPPYILAGHSRGGLYVRAFQEQYPETVSGLILVDSAFEPEFKDTPEVLKQSLNQAFEQAGLLFKLGSWLAPIGLLRILQIPQKQIQNLPLSEDEKAEYAAIWNQSHVWKTVMIQENAWASQDFRPDPPNTLDSLPLIVIRRGQPRKDIPGLSQIQANLNEALHIRAQQKLARLSPIGEEWVAKESGHMIPWEQPNMVVEAINTLWKQIRETDRNPIIKTKHDSY